MKALAIFALAILPGLASASALTALQALPIQDGGRVKPYDTFARESLQLIYGKAKFNDKQAAEVVLTWYLIPEHWDKKEFLQTRRPALKEALKLDVERSYFSPAELMANERLPLLLQDLNNKLEAKEKLDPYWQDVQRMQNQLGLYRAISAGVALKIVPAKDSQNWLSIHDAGPEWKARFEKITAEFAQALTNSPDSKLAAAIEEFTQAARAENPSSYPDSKVIQVEVHYNQFHPFMYAWIFYLATLILLGWASIGGSNLGYRLSWVTMLVGFVLHIYGFVLRCYIAGRPPVSNMYESVIWVSFGAVLFGIIFEAMKRKKFAAFGAAFVGVLCLIVADFSPNILDPSIQPLEPVLRSNLWLMIHVMTITLSYSAFFLALLMGDVGLISFLRGHIEKGNDIAEAAYRVVQVGVVLLAAGTILGGVWADYSWGRFWGWDPKETWALIALLGYLAVLHAKKAGLVRNFGFLAGCIVSFSLVLMAWYGVNFVLGVGLHSYGFGGGGVPYVAGFVAVHLIYVAFAATVQRGKLTPRPR
jgi:ABC-type transport system involved in cytochrome c biogenesis permease subunit